MLGKKPHFPLGIERGLDVNWGLPVGHNEGTEGRAGTSAAPAWLLGAEFKKPEECLRISGGKAARNEADKGCPKASRCLGCCSSQGVLFAVASRRSTREIPNVKSPGGWLFQFTNQWLFPPGNT